MRVAHNSKFKTQNSKIKKRRQTLSTSVCLLYYFFSDLLSKKITQQRSPQP